MAESDDERDFKRRDKFHNERREGGDRFEGGGGWRPRGGGGYGPGGVTAPSPTPAPGDWYGQNGGSGIMMIRFAHPGD